MDSGLQFDFSYAAGTSWEQIVAFETAGMMWSDYISDDMTVNIHVEMTNTLPDNVIGGALPGMVADVNYTNFRNAYQADVTSWRDRRDFDSLSIKHEGYGGIGPGGTWEKFEALIDLGGSKYLEDSAELNMTRANAKALGLIAGNDSNLDGYILMNDLSSTSLDWDYNRGWTKSNSLDFLSTAIHEVGHVLGFVSGVDKYEGVKFYDNDSFWSHFGTTGAFKSYINDILDYANPLDLFRYSSESLGSRTEYNVIDMSVGTQTYFGPAKLWDAYATGKETNLDGDGFQASHWQQKDDNSKVIGIMDPLMKPGIVRRISDRDLRAMDAIGFDLNNRGNNLLAMNKAETGWKPVTGKGTNIGTLQWRAKEHIAKSLYSNGQASWVDWWMNNAPEYSSAMTSDRSWKVDRMIDQSQVYEGRRTNNGRTRYRQEIFWQEAYFSSISEQYLNAATESSSNLSFSLAPLKENDQAVSQNNDSDVADTNETVKKNNEASSVTMNLLSLAEVHEPISTVPTRLNVELVEQASLYNEQLVESLIMPLA